MFAFSIETTLFIFVYGLFNAIVQNSDYVMLNDWAIVTNELERSQKITAEASLRYYLGICMEKQEKYKKYVMIVGVLAEI
jgi:hypothetical protein